jgi:hypothetical protein
MEIKKNKKTHYDRILAHLQAKGYITSWQAIREYGITRLSAVIFDLRRDGHNIESQTVCKKNRYGDKIHYAKYVLKKNDTIC